MTTSDLGRVRPIYRGAYSPTYPYTPLDFLTYGGHTYFCVAAATGILPTNALYFQPIVDPAGLVTTDDLAAALVIIDAALALRLRIDAPQALTSGQKQGLWSALSVVAHLASGAALPTADIGPIWHDDYADVMTWRTIGAYTGYASVNLAVVSHCAAASAVPPGWRKRNGALLSRVTYAALFGAIGTTYGAGDGASTFALPDDRGYSDRGYDDGRGVDSGRTIGSYQADQNKSHSHSYNGRGNTFAAPAGSYMTEVWNGLAAGYTTTADGGSEVTVKNRALHAIIHI